MEIGHAGGLHQRGGKAVEADQEVWIHGLTPVEELETAFQLRQEKPHPFRIGGGCRGAGLEQFGDGEGQLFGEFAEFPAAHPGEDALFGPCGDGIQLHEFRPGVFGRGRGLAGTSRRQEERKNKGQMPGRRQKVKILVNLAGGRYV